MTAPRKPSRPRRPGPPRRRSGPSRPPVEDPARQAVLDVLAAVRERDAYANLALPSLLRQRGINGRDAALATELCYGTLRGQGSYDAILNVCSDRRVARMDLPVREVLRLGVHQLLGTRIAAHAAVTTSVDLAKDVAGRRLVAILRLTAHDGRHISVEFRVTDATDLIRRTCGRSQGGQPQRDTV